MSRRRVAIVGATGAVGRELLRLMGEREFSLGSLRLFASPRSAGQALAFRGERIRVEVLTEGALDGVDLAFFSAGAGVARDHAQAAVAGGCVVIDNSSAFREDADVPLVVPEANGAALSGHGGLISSPNCTVTILALALAPLHAAAGLRRVIVSTYQAASGAGQRAVAEMFQGARAVLDGVPAPAPAALPASLAFSLFPQVGEFARDGSTTEEGKVRAELRRILGAETLPVDATCVRVPVARCHSASVSVELARDVDLEEAQAILGAAPGLIVAGLDDAHDYPTPESFGGVDGCGIGRIRRAQALDPGLSFWMCGDQLRKGAALNAIQIAEAL